MGAASGVLPPQRATTKRRSDSVGEDPFSTRNRATSSAAHRSAGDRRTVSACFEATARANSSQVDLTGYGVGSSCSGAVAATAQWSTASVSNGNASAGAGRLGSFARSFCGGKTVTGVDGFPAGAGADRARASRQPVAPATPSATRENRTTRWAHLRRCGSAPSPRSGLRTSRSVVMAPFDEAGARGRQLLAVTTSDQPPGPPSARRGVSAHGKPYLALPPQRPRAVPPPKAIWARSAARKRRVCVSTVGRRARRPTARSTTS